MQLEALDQQVGNSWLQLSFKAMQQEALDQQVGNNGLHLFQGNAAGGT